MLNGLSTALDATGYEFAFAAWSHSPDSDYGVYSLSEQTSLSADENPLSEIMLEGFVDYFTRDPSDIPKTKIETELKRLGCFFRLESVQYEDDTGYIHYEWRWKDTNGSI